MGNAWLFLTVVLALVSVLLHSVALLLVAALVVVLMGVTRLWARYCLARVEYRHSLSAYRSRFVATHPIGALVGVTRVDFVKKLGDLQLSSIVTVILSLVGDRDLCAVSCVSKRWGEACSDDLASRERKERYIAIHTREKENVRLFKVLLNSIISSRI